MKADQIVQADLNKKDNLAAALDTIETVIALSAPDEVAATQQPLTALEAGGEQTWTLLETIANCPATRKTALIYMSTFHVYGPNAKGEVREVFPPFPVHPYSLGRYLGETIVQMFRKRHNLNALCVRLSNAFGAPAAMDVPRWSLVFNDLCLQAIRQKKMVLKTSGRQKRNFITMHDTVRALEFLPSQASLWPTDGLIHLGSESHWSILEVARMIAQECQRCLGYTPELKVPSGEEAVSTIDFHYNVDRLKSLGFSWDHPVQQEIESTLKLCLDQRVTNSPRVI
jgi:UDP-glucose 4-epimerase